MNPLLSLQTYRSYRFWFYVGVAAVLFVMSGRSRAGEVTVRSDDGQPWTIEIRPAARAAAAPLVPPAPEAIDVVPARLGLQLAAAQNLAIAAPGVDGIEIQPGPDGSVVVNGQSYDAVYNSIPFSRAEYLANPGYRHEATMEILFGTLRPTTVHKNVPAQAEPEPLWTPYRPYIFAEWDQWQTSPLLHPRVYSPLRYPGGCCYGYGYGCW